MTSVGNAAGAHLLARTDVDVVRAAGGVLIRRSKDGWLEVAVVHRPGREDWSFPKGKLEPGESFEDGALREVDEETGLRCHLVRFLGHTQYRDRKERPKIVAYWLMEPVDGRFRPNDEVDELRWLPPAEADRLLSYDRDRELLLSVFPAAEPTSAAV